MSEHEDMMERLETADTVSPPTQHTTLTREPRYVKKYYCPTEILRGESQGGTTERTLVDWDDMRHLEKENYDLRQALAQQAQELERLNRENDGLKEQCNAIAHTRTFEQTSQLIADLKRQLAAMSAERDAQRIVMEADERVLQRHLDHINRLTQQLAAMSAERDNYKRAADENGDRWLASQARVRELDKRLEIVGKDFTANMLYQGQLERTNADLQATLAERERRIGELEFKVRETVGMYQARIDERKAERDLAVQDAARLREALQVLYDEQNDAPLENRRQQWQAAMTLASDALRETGA